MEPEARYKTRYCQLVLEGLSTAVLLFDRTLRLQYMNPSAEMLFAVTARHMIGHAASELIQCPGGIGEDHLARAAQTGHPFTERELTLTLPGPGPGPRTITVDCTVLPMPEIAFDDAPAGGLLVEIQQIDRHVRITREEQLLAQHQTVRELLRNLAHEIKNPLGGLRGAAQLLEGELPDRALHEYTRIIIEEADRLQNLVNRMLGPNRLPRPEWVNVHTLVERVRKVVLAESGERIRVVRDYDPSIPEVHVDPDRIIQALLNIAGNAARALAARAGAEIRLRTRVMRQVTIGNHRHRLVVRIDIEDNGPGIPEELRERLFYPMVTASEGGTGLGLSIAQSLIHQHGGLVEYQSEPGHTVFSVLIPVEPHPMERDHAKS